MKKAHSAILGATALAVAGMVLMAIPRQASAVPSFARKYHTSCMTCHVAPPKLNAFGRAFRNRGYRMPGGDENFIKQQKAKMGAEAWKQVWPKGIWPSDIPGGTMLGFGLSSNYIVNPNEKVTNEFDGIDEISLLLGGTVGESFSFFGDVDLFEEGEPGGIGRLFFQYNHPSNLFNVRIGQFEPRAVPFSNHRRLIRATGFLTNTLPTIPADNFFGFSPNQRGLELWGGHEGPGGRGGLMWAFGVVNGQFGGAAESLADTPQLSGLISELKEQAEAQGGEFDVNSNKDFYFQASYKIGGLGVFGSGGRNSMTESNNWRDNSLTLNGYYYRGRAAAFLQNPLDPLAEEVFDPNGNRFYRTGVTFDWWFRDLNFFGGYQLNRDRLRDGRLFDVSIITAEADYVTPWPWVQPGVRFETVNPSFAPPFNRTTLSTTFLLRANVIFAVEGSFSRKAAPDLPPFGDQFRASARFLF